MPNGVGYDKLRLAILKRPVLAKSSRKQAEPKLPECFKIVLREFHSFV